MEGMAGQRGEGGDGEVRDHRHGVIKKVKFCTGESFLHCCMKKRRPCPKFSTSGPSLTTFKCSRQIIVRENPNREKSMLAAADALN